MSGQKYAAVKGMSDLMPGDIEVWQRVESVMRNVCARFGYGELRTPMLEDTALFVRTVGETSDIVGKEMYTFEDKGGRSVSLRPEGTAPAARAYIEHSLVNKEPVTKWFYTGPMFRYERMKTGRYRQFSQLGAEAYGSATPAQDVEMMDLVAQILSELGLSGISLNINSLGDDACRPAYQTALVTYLRSHEAELCGDCKTRIEKNPLRVLDCKQEGCMKIAAGAPNILESLCEPCQVHFAEVKRQLDRLGLPYVVNPRMVRGLDYYTRTAFEFIAADPMLGTASTVGGGGRYDKLIRQLGGPDVPGVGFALGQDRLCLLLAGQKEQWKQRPELFVAVAEETAWDEAFSRVSSLRKAGFAVELDTRGGSLKSQMKRADRSGARYTLVLGGLELSSGDVVLKHMAGGEPKKATLTGLADTLSALRGTP